MDNARLQPVGESGEFFRALATFGIAALVMIGVGGSVYYLVAPGGLLAVLFGRSFAGGLAALLAFAVIGLSAWLTRDWLNLTRPNFYSVAFVYVFAAAGALFAVTLLMR
jgi:hypothetical protein